MSKREQMKDQIIREWIEANEVVPGDPGANRMIRGEHKKGLIREEIAKYDTNAISPLAARIRQIHQKYAQSQIRDSQNFDHQTRRLAGGSGSVGGSVLCQDDPGPIATHLKNFGELD